MKKLEIVNKASRSFHKVGFTFKKHSPEILIAAGVVGVVSSAVMACKATTKLSGILEEQKEQKDQINDYIKDHGYTEKYTEEDHKKDLAVVTVQSGLKVAKLYAPAVALGTLSLGAILTSNNILRKRNVALAAAYTAVDRSFKEYRGRVIERFGKELDRELRYNIKAKEVEEVVVNPDGTETIEKKVVEVADNPNEYSDYARFFDVGNDNWSKDPEFNLMFLKRQQDYANDKLKEQGYLFLNDVYTMIGIPKTKAGQVVGWVYDEKNPIGDNYVDFGIYNLHRQANRDFVNGYERTILLDFNVDGDILDLM